ncbi:MAG: hypothetical protein AAF394_03845 [Planctomycetota bacterium]
MTRRRDPYGLFGAGYGQQYHGQLQQRVEKSDQPAPWLNMLIGAGLVIVIQLGMQRLDGGGSGGERERDRQEQQDDGDTPKFERDFVIFLHQRAPMPIDEQLLFEDTLAWTGETDGLEARSFDQDDPTQAVQELISFAGTKGVKPPCIVWKSDGEPKSAIAMPSDLSGVKKVFR